MHLQIFATNLLHLSIMWLYFFLQLFVLYLEFTQTSCSLCSYREAAPGLGKKLQTLILPLFRNLIWWSIVLACYHFLVLLSALSSALQNPVSLRYLKAAVSVSLGSASSGLVCFYLIFSQITSKQKTYKQLHSTGNLYLGEKATFLVKIMPQDDIFNCLSGKGCKSPENIRKMSACKSADEPGHGSIPCFPH